MGNKKHTHPALVILSSYKNIIWPEIETYLYTPDLPDHFKINGKYKSDEKYFWKITRDYPERKGKYLRPTLLMLAAEAMGKKKRYSLKAAAAMQLSEEWILIHDDFEDNSVKRRGKPALHRIYGAEQAINSGDALHAVMWRIIFDIYKKLDKKIADKVVDEFYSIITRTIIGQSSEIKLMQEKIKTFSDNDWYFIADGKSSYYSITGPLRLGSIIGEASKDQLYKITEFGFNLGRCFQLIDDILDITSDFNGLKEFANDIYEGKKTLIMSHFLKNASGRDRDYVVKVLNKKREEKSLQEVLRVVRMLDDCGSIAYAKKRAEEYKDHALKVFDEDLTFFKNKKAAKNLRELAVFVMERDM